MGKKLSHIWFFSDIKVSGLLFAFPRDNFPAWISVWECVPFPVYVCKFPKCHLFLLGRRADHSEFSVRSQTCSHGFALRPLVLTLPGMPGEGWERMREQSHWCWSGGGGEVEGFCVHCSNPRRRCRVELGPSLHWTQMVGFGKSVNSETAHIPVQWSTIFNTKQCYSRLSLYCVVLLTIIQ